MRKPLNVTVSEELVARAKALGINVSRAAEEGIELAIRAYRKPGFLKGKVEPLPESFFEPLPEDELRRWGG
ncbi:MAG TPA: type II toxin-antitoxin system CcdA family antitoxin [Labilithrix sp.]|nr:type II toxin-antitoxin system CcdA family antitoxin [Labilithrix sp.]